MALGKFGGSEVSPLLLFLLLLFAQRTVVSSDALLQLLKLPPSPAFLDYFLQRSGSRLNVILFANLFNESDRFLTKRECSSLFAGYLGHDKIILPLVRLFIILVGAVRAARYPRECATKRWNSIRNVVPSPGRLTTEMRAP